MVTINGERREISPSATLSDVLNELALSPERVAIELNRAIVKREKWSDTAVGENAEIEIVQFVGGG